jgi:hypothetical protein
MIHSHNVSLISIWMLSSLLRASHPNYRLRRGVSTQILYLFLMLPILSRWPVFHCHNDIRWRVTRIYSYSRSSWWCGINYSLTSSFNGPNIFQDLAMYVLRSSTYISRYSDGIRAGRPRNRGLFPGRAIVETVFGSHHAFYPTGTAGPFPGDKATEAWSWPSASIWCGS